MITMIACVRNEWFPPICPKESSDTNASFSGLAFFGGGIRRCSSISFIRTLSNVFSGGYREVACYA